MKASKFGNFGRRKVDNKYVDIPTRGGLYYGKSDPAFQAALALAKTNDSKYDTKKPKRVNVNKAFSRTRANTRQRQLKSFRVYG